MPFDVDRVHGVAGDRVIVGDHYEWGFQIPNFGTIRYTITTDEKTWFEIGEFSRMRQAGGNQGRHCASDVLRP